MRSKVREPMLFELSCLSAVFVGAVSTAGAACPNDALRVAQGSAFLPECRAYEMVSPPAKDGNDVAPSTSTVRAADHGGAVTWLSFGSFGDTEGTGVFSNYLSERTETGWVTEGISPPAEPAPLVAAGLTGFSEDLLTAFVNNGTPLTPGAPPQTINLYARDSSGTYTLLSPSTNATPLEPDPFGFHAAKFIDVAPESGRVVFSSDANYLPEASGTGTKIYASDGGAVSLVSLLPGGDLAPTAARPGFVGTISMDHTMSKDGSRIAFTVPAEPFSLEEEGGQLYLRDGSRTVHVSGSQRSPADPAGPQPAMFWTMSDDGSQIFFTSSEKLTDDSTACGSECPYSGGTRKYSGAWAELYRYDLETEQLTDLTTHPGGAAVQGVLGATGDGSRIYFVAFAELAAGAEAGQLNLYMWHQGSTRLVTVLRDAPGVQDDRSNWDDFDSLPVARLSSDGERLLFRSESSLAGFDNGGAAQFYLYEADADQLSCVSCPPAGGPAAGPAKIDVALLSTNSTGQYLPRALTRTGEKVFFSSPDPLVQADTNGRYDAYLYDAGTGSTSLISTGRSERDSYFADASANGSDVFVITREQILPQDRDVNLDLYDVRVAGGHPFADEAETGAGCEGDECQGPAVMPPLPVRPGSAGIDSSGDPRPRRQRARKSCGKKRKAAHRVRKAGKKRCSRRKGAGR